MSIEDYEDTLRHQKDNGFVELEVAIISLKEHLDAVKKEPQKLRESELNKVMKELKNKERICRINCKAYINHLEKNLKMYRKKIP
ncbi:MAG: hypothetical protein ACREAS_04980 [Nitrososphaera sp.]